MATPITARQGWPAERRFYTLMALAILAVVYVGFAPTYFLRPWFPETAAAFERWPVVGAGGPPFFFAAMDAFLLPMIAWDLVTRRSLHPVTLRGGLLLIASQPLRLWLMGTAAWASVAARLI